MVRNTAVDARTDKMDVVVLKISQRDARNDAADTCTWYEQVRLACTLKEDRTNSTCY